MSFLHTRLRIVLPLVNVLLTVLLFWLGDLQVRQIVLAHGAYEGISDGAATARYLAYAVNAPAWTLLPDTRSKIWSPSTYWTGYDVRFLLLVAVMWLLIGFALDRRISHDRASKILGRWKSLFAVVCLIYALFICYAMLPHRHGLPLTAYTVGLSNGVTSGWWWYGLGLGWAVALVIVGLWLIRRTGELG